MDTIDVSGPARKRIRDTRVIEIRTAQRHAETREDRVPAVDWTGHQYKAASELTNDHNHVGRTSSARRGN